MLGLVLMLASLTGCTLKTPTLPALSTGDIQVTTGIELTGIELTGMVVKKLIEERNTQPKDESKINEPDIDLMQKIIDLFK